jgi:hypothetical protein
MAPFYLIVTASIFAHIALFCFFGYICAKNVYKRDRQHLQKDNMPLHRTRKQKVYKHAEQTPNNEQLYGYQVHCEIGTIVISNN